MIRALPLLLIALALLTALSLFVPLGSLVELRRADPNLAWELIEFLDGDTDGDR